MLPDAPGLHALGWPRPDEATRDGHRYILHLHPLLGWIREYEDSSREEWTP